MPVDHDDHPRMALAHPHDGQALHRYRELYAYDVAGNLLELTHQANGGSWTRPYHYAQASNRLLATALPGDPDGVFSATYDHDPHGNLTRMPHLADDAMRMLQIFNHHGVRNEQVLIVINRFEKGASISLEDMQRAVHGIEVVTLPSDFKTVAESINLGIPMYEHARGSAVTKALMNLGTTLGGRPVKAAGGLFGKAFSGLLRKENGRQSA